MSLKDAVARASANKGLLVPLMRDFIAAEEQAVLDGRMKGWKIAAHERNSLLELLAMQEDEVKNGQDKGIVGRNDSDGNPLLHPSQMMKCLRQQAYKYFKAPGQAGSSREVFEGHQKMSNGTYFHYRIQSLLMRMGILVAPEILIDGFLGPCHVVGHGDGIVVVSEEHFPNFGGVFGQRYLLELKSANDRNFCLFAGGKIYESYLYQVQIYMHFVKAKGCILLFEDKDNQRKLDILIEYNPEVVDKAQERMSDLHFALLNGELPPAEKAWTCKWCPYGLLCADENETRRWLDEVHKESGKADALRDSGNKTSGAKGLRFTPASKKN